MKTKKRSISVLILLLVMSTVFASCGGNGSSTGESSSSGVSSSSTTASAGELSAPGVFPITEEKSKLSVLMQNSAIVEDFATNEFTLWYQELTNVEIDWELLPVVEGGTKLNLILAGGTYPDIVMNVKGIMTSSQAMSYASQGIFIPLNNLVDEHSVELAKIFKEEETAYLRPMITYPDGEMYYLPHINQCYHCSAGLKMWINMPWMDTLGLAVPTNTDEFADMLRAFRDDDPNGNGKADEIPYSTQKDFHPGYLMASFAYTDNALSLYLQDGKVVTSINTEGWREGLRYQRDLYAEGLIAPESFTQDWEQLRQQGENPEAMILGAADALHTGQFTQFYGESNRWLDYEIVPPLAGPNGEKPVTRWAPYQATVDTMITNQCENPALATKWIDGMYSQESTMRTIYGRPDQEWIWAEDGDIGINGKPALFKLLVPWSETVQNITWSQAGPSARTNTFRMGETAKADDPLETLLYNATKLYEPYAMELKDILPPQVFSDSQSETLSDIEKTLKDYLKEKNAAFIMGDSDLETEWDDYVETLEGLGLSDLIEINQVAYDEKYGNK